MFEKKNGKRFLASVMALVMLLSLAPVGALAVEDEEQNQEVVALPANQADPKSVVTDEENTANTNEELTPPPRNEGDAGTHANNNDTSTAVSEMPVIVKPTEVLDQPFGVDSDTSKDNGIAEYGSNDYKARTVKVKVAVYATDGSSAGSKVNTDIAKLLGIPCKQNDGYYPIGVIEIDKNLVTGRTPYINTEKDWEEVKAAIEKIDTEDLTNNTVDNVNNVAGSENKENTIAKNLDKVQVDLKHEAGSHKTALFTWKGDSQNIRGNYKYHLDLRFATVTLTFTGVKENGETVDMGSRIYLKDTEILKPGTSDDFYLENIPEDYQIAGYYTTYSLNEEYTFGQAADKDTTIYVKLEEKPVQITYDLNGGNLNGDIEPVVYNDLKVGDNMRTPSDPKREGYTFKGWKDKDGKSPSQQVTGDVTYTAQWEQIPDPEPVQSTDVYVYFRVVNTNDENVSIDGLSVKYNANAGGNTWCTFGKISTTKELTLNNVKQDAETQLTATNAQIHIDNAGIKDKVLSNVTWYQLGTWAGAPGYHDSGTYWHLDGKITGYTVTYASEGTPQNMPQNDVKYYLSNTTYTISNTVPTRTGYTFAGWKSNITNDNKTYKADGENTSITIPKQNVVLTAQWTPNTYKVTYTDGVDNEDVFTDVVRDVNYKSTIPAFGEQNPVRIGYTFNGWTSSVEGVQPGDLMPNQDVIFTATWNINSYSVTYEYEGNYPENAPALDSLNNNVLVPYGQTVTVDKTVPAATVSGYTFSGWKIGTEDAGTQFSMPANNVVLKGSWTANGDTKYKVEYYQENLNGEYTKVETVPGTGTTGTSVTAEIKTYTGFIYNKNMSTTSDKVKADGSLVLKLYYTRNTYTVTYMLDGVLYQEPVAYKFGASVTIKDDPQNLNDGLKFAGWKIGKDKATNFTMPAKDVTITGQTGKPWTTVKMPYVVEHYKWNGTNYKLADSERFSALEGTKVTAIAKSYENEGYMLNPQAPDTIKEGTVVKPTLENDQVKMLTLKLYYDIDKIGGGENKDQPDNIPDRYQVTINYVSSNTNWGTVNRSKEVITLSNKESDKWLETGTVTAPSCTATSAGGRCYFVNWTKKQEGSTASSTVISSAKLPAQTFNAKGGDVYTFTANFDRSSGGGSSRPSTPTVTIPDDVPTGLNGTDHYAYIIGYGNNDVRPQNNITRAEVATIFFRLLTDETRTANMTKSNSYNDVKDGDWFCCAVSTLSKMGIIKGYEDGSFKPNDPISRAEFAAIAARFDPDGDKTPATFADVTSHWAKDEISIAANHGWIKGYEDGSFKPDQKITRAETMTLVNRVLNRLPEAKDDLHKDMKTWVDNMDETAWYYLAVQEATNSHYFKNKTGTKFEQWTDLRDTRDWSELEK